MEREVLSVSQVNQFIKELLDQVPLLGSLAIRGELSNYKMYPSGHHYFTLKDEEGAMRCVMFKGQAMRLRFRPENGMKVIATGRISVYPRDGAYQLYCDTLTPDGVGDLHVAFEQLKERLYREGLFAQEHKKPIPAYPQCIALITSPAGAAVRDMLRILKRRYPLAKVKLLPVRVQGVEAPPEIAGAIRYADRHKVADLIITGRGGGSIEDLWAFNEEIVARAIYASETPVISAVGHEPDVTIADFVADARAATPTHGAELAVPDQTELYERLRSISLHLVRDQNKRLELLRHRLDALAEKRVILDPLAPIQDRRQHLDQLQRELTRGTLACLEQPRRQLAALTAALDAMSPLKVLSRGYAAVTDSSGAVLKSAGDTAPGQRVDVLLGEGGLRCLVEEVRMEEKDDGNKEKADL